MIVLNQSDMKGTYMEGHVRYKDSVPFIMHLYSLDMLRKERELHRKRGHWDIVEWCNKREKELMLLNVVLSRQEDNCDPTEDTNPTPPVRGSTRVIRI